MQVNKTSILDMWHLCAEPVKYKSVRDIENHLDFFTWKEITSILTTQQKSFQQQIIFFWNYWQTYNVLV